jgi:triacylglycerol lipase
MEITMKCIRAILAVSVFAFMCAACNDRTDNAVSTDDMMASLASSGNARYLTKYPIILVHGLGASDNNIMSMSMWGKIPQTLKDKGVELYTTHQDAFNGIAENGTSIAKEIGQLFALHPTWTKVNIIAHSKGPLDSRYFISNTNIPGKGPAKNYVASLTSISGVHRGSEIADLIWGLYKGIPVIGQPVGDVIAAVVNAFVKLFYFDESDQNCMKALYNLTSAYMINIGNPSIPDVKGVYYQSWAGKLKYLDANPENIMIGPLWEVMKAMGSGDNDGLVSVASSKWGNFRGALTGAWWCGGVNHVNECDLLLGTNLGFSAPAFYLDIVKELKTKGY